MSPARVAHLRGELNAFLAEVDYDARREADPVGVVWGYDRPEDREVVALIAATLAYGQVKMLRRAARQVLAQLGESPAQTLRNADPVDLGDFVYRMTRGDDMVALLRAIGATLRAEGSLEALFRVGYGAADSDYRPALTHFVHTLRERGGYTSRGFHYLLADPARGGACKRLNLFLRWVIRGPDRIDLGLWSLPARKLVIPLDTHITRIARYLDLGRRKTVDWKRAVEVRDHLAQLDPDDPLKYDFALCHMGISGQCPRRRDPSICASCPIESVCTLD